MMNGRSTERKRKIWRKLHLVVDTSTNERAHGDPRIARSSTVQIGSGKSAMVMASAHSPKQPCIK